jgi:protein gp37
MADKTGIEWTDSTWNPVTGCTEVSPGCDHCYAKTFAERWRGTEGHYFENGFDVQLRPDKLDLPLRWKKPRRIFVNSMSDLFHDDVPSDFIAKVFAITALTPQHTFQILTKRHARMRSLLHADYFRVNVRGHIAWWSDYLNLELPVPYWPLPNVWLGVSAENQQWANLRIPTLLDTPAAVRFISAEPLLGPISIFASSKIDDDPGLDWVIAGGESGRGARPMHPGWIRSLRNECTFNGVPFLFKQWGEWTLSAQYGATRPGQRRLVYLDGPSAEIGRDYASGAPLQPGSQLMYRAGKHAAGRELDGRTWDQYPQQVTA